MRRARVRAAGVFALATLTAATSVQASPLQTTAGYSAAVTRICARALLFEGTHAIGTRAGAIAVSRDIRRTGSNRLRLVDAVPKPPSGAELARRWIAVERRLVETYSSTYMRIWYAIERARGSRARANLPTVLRRLVQEPATLERRAGEFQARLGVPDCTGGNRPQSPTPIGA